MTRVTLGTIGQGYGLAVELGTIGQGCGLTVELEASRPG
jgi:hypothetical protein